MHGVRYGFLCSIWEIRYAQLRLPVEQLLAVKLQGRIVFQLWDCSLFSMNWLTHEILRARKQKGMVAWLHLFFFVFSFLV